MWLSLQRMDILIIALMTPVLIASLINQLETV